MTNEELILKSLDRLESEVRDVRKDVSDIKAGQKALEVSQKALEVSLDAHIAYGKDRKSDRDQRWTVRGIIGAWIGVAVAAAIAWFK